jgi:hypothetical protein
VRNALLTLRTVAAAEPKPKTDKTAKADKTPKTNKTNKTDKTSEAPPKRRPQ